MTTTNRKARKFTAETATEFDTYSAANAMTLRAAADARGCQCEPYKDWFTYNRWQAQGMQVQQGEKSTKIEIVVPFEVTDKEGNVEKKISFKTASVFCRCQVKSKAESKWTPKPIVEAAAFAAVEI